MIDAIRRRQIRLGTAIDRTLEQEEEAHEMPDDRLRLIFTCCHPALHIEAQVALTLRTLGGLTTTEIARSFLLPEPALAQRIVRAKRKIQDACIPYEVPPLHRLAERLAAVQVVVYLIFSEGCSATFGDALIRGDLCAEAIRLSRLLCELMPRDADNRGLLALMLLQDSRRAARTGPRGELVTLDDQDRALWNQDAIREGLAMLPAEKGTYALQAGIAAVHAHSGTAQDTDWRAIAGLYEDLAWFVPSTVVALNHAVAVAMSDGFPAGLARMDRITEPDRYYLFHSARADLLRRLGRHAEAAAACHRAIDLATNLVERTWLSARLDSVSSGKQDIIIDSG